MKLEDERSPWRQHLKDDLTKNALWILDNWAGRFAAVSRDLDTWEYRNMPIATKEARYAASQAVMPHMSATLQPARNFTSIWVPKGYFLLSNDPHITAQCEIDDIEVEYIRKEFAERLQILSQHPVQMTCGSSQMLFADRKSFDLKQIMEASAQTADICKQNLGNSRSQRQVAQITNMKTLSFSGVGLKSAQFPENGTSLASLVAMSAQAGQQYLDQTYV